MFSGIVEGIGKVVALESKQDSIYIEILPPKNFSKNLKKGASISVDGVCLTSLDNGKKVLKFDVIEETLSRTNFKTLKKRIYCEFREIYNFFNGNRWAFDVRTYPF